MTEETDEAYQGEVAVEWETRAASANMELIGGGPQQCQVASLQVRVREAERWRGMHQPWESGSLAHHGGGKLGMVQRRAHLYIRSVEEFKDVIHPVAHKCPPLPCPPVLHLPQERASSTTLFPCELSRLYHDVQGVEEKEVPTRGSCVADLVPPWQFIYATIVKLSKFTVTTWPAKLKAQCLIAHVTAFVSRTLVWRPSSAEDHKPDTTWSFHSAPKPAYDVSVLTVTCGVQTRNGLSSGSMSLLVHHSMEGCSSNSSMIRE